MRKLMVVALFAAVAYTIVAGVASLATDAASAVQAAADARDAAIDEASR